MYIQEAHKLRNFGIFLQGEKP